MVWHAPFAFYAQRGGLAQALCLVRGRMDVFRKKKTGLISRAIASDPLAGLGCGC